MACDACEVDKSGIVWEVVSAVKREEQFEVLEWPWRWTHASLWSLCIIMCYNLNDSVELCVLGVPTDWCSKPYRALEPNLRRDWNHQRVDDVLCRWRWRWWKTCYLHLIVQVFNVQQLRDIYKYVICDIALICYALCIPCGSLSGGVGAASPNANWLLGCC